MPPSTPDRTRITQLLSLAQRYVEETITKNKNETSSSVRLPDRLLPDATLDARLEVARELLRATQEHQASSSSIHSHEELLVLEALFRDAEGLSSRHAATVDVLKQRVRDAILPTALWAERSPYSTDPIAATSFTEFSRVRAMNVAGLHLLSLLEKISPASDDETTVNVVSCLASFTDTREKWSCPEASEQAYLLLNTMLSQLKGEPERFQALISRLLEEHVKPLFVKTKNPAVTARGRRVLEPPPSTYMASDPDTEIKPWKFHDIYIVTVLRWILQSLTASTIESHWPLLIPPILAFIDDATIKVKVRGCELLTILLEKVPQPLLARTGLGEVFQGALMPCLLYLPSLTEETESIAMLNGAYPTLITLYHTLFPGDTHRALRMQALDKLMRDGIFKGYAHGGENVRIAQLLVGKMTDLIDAMGLEAAKHLKHIIPMLSQILSSPFATAYPPLIEVSVRALRTVVVNIWPRVAYHRGEILEGLLCCWGRLHDEAAQTADLQSIKSNIEQTVRMVTAILKTQMDVAIEYQILLQSDSRLQCLLAI